MEASTPKDRGSGTGVVAARYVYVVTDEPLTIRPGTITVAGLCITMSEGEGRLKTWFHVPVPTAKSAGSPRPTGPKGIVTAEVNTG
jgi:hypothetical protein